jgi:hypothetical protein
MFSPTTIGGTRAAIQLGTSLAECDDKRFVRVLTRHLSHFYRNLKIMATLPKSQRETAIWAYYKEVKAKSEGVILTGRGLHMFYDHRTALVDRFDENDISFSLYDSVIKAAIRETLRKAEEADKTTTPFVKSRSFAEEQIEETGVTAIHG